MTQELTFSGLIVKFQFSLLVVVIPLVAGLPTPQQEGSMGRGFPSGMACTGSASNQMSSLLSLPGRKQGLAGELWVGRDPIQASPTGDKERNVSCNSAISVFVQLLLGQEHLLAKWHNQEHLGVGCMFVLILSTVSQMLRIGIGNPAVARVCVNRFPRNKWLFF